MTKCKAKPERDLEKAYSTKDFVAKLRRLADSLEQKKRFRNFDDISQEFYGSKGKLFK
jgi:hypothetical protein